MGTCSPRGNVTEGQRRHAGGSRRLRLRRRGCPRGRSRSDRRRACPLAQPAPVVDDAVSDVVATADEVVSDAREAVEETVSEPSEALGNVAAPLAQIVDKTPADELVSGVTRTADPVIRTADPVIASVAESSRSAYDGGFSGGAGFRPDRAGSDRRCRLRRAKRLRRGHAPDDEAKHAIGRKRHSSGSSPCVVESTVRRHARRPDRRNPCSEDAPDPTAIAASGARDDGSIERPGSSPPVRSALPGGHVCDGCARRRRCGWSAYRRTAVRPHALGPEDRPRDAAWTHPREAGYLPLSRRAPRLGPQAP